MPRSLAASGPRTPRARTLSWVGLAAPLVGMGVAHQLAPTPFDAIVPRWLPGTARFWTLASGVVEIAVGTAVAVPATRRLGAGTAAALFVAVYPANLQMAWDWRSEPWPYRVVALARLPLQVPMVRHALRVRQDAA